MKNRKGFTLVEIMIVVAIIALLATIALPGLLRTRMTANESNAIATLRSIATAAETFRSAQVDPTYPGDLAALTAPATGPVYVSGIDAGGHKGGYDFDVDGDLNTFQAIADPTTDNQTGARSFCIDHTGVMRAQMDDNVAPVAGVVCPGTPLEI